MATKIYIAQARRDAQGGGVVPPQFVLDKIAEQQLTAGFDTRRANRCDRCFCARPVNGECC